MTESPTLIATRYIFALDHAVTIRNEGWGVMQTAVAYVTCEPGEIAVIFRNLNPGRRDRQPIIFASDGGSVENAQRKLLEALDQVRVPQVIESPTSKPLPPAQLVGALQDNVHIEVSKSRPAKVARTKRGSSDSPTE